MAEVAMQAVGQQIDRNTTGVAALDVRVRDLEAGGDLPSSCHDHDEHFTPNWSVDDINERMRELVVDDGGGDVFFDGVFNLTTGPIIRWPGINVDVAGYPNPSSKRSRTRFVKRHSDPAAGCWDFVDLAGYDGSLRGGDREAWWGGRVTGLVADMDGKPGPAYRIIGGNRSIMDTCVVVGECDTGWEIPDATKHDPRLGRNEYDGQYSMITNFTVYRFRKYGVDAQRGSPDQLWMHGMVYGKEVDNKPIAGTIGYNLRSGGGARQQANNFTTFDCHAQFVGRAGWFIDGNETLVIGGSFENNGTVRAGSRAIVLGPNSRDTVVAMTSFARKDDVEELFEIMDGAEYYRFRDLTKVRESDLDNLTAEQRTHFDLIPR